MRLGGEPLWRDGRKGPTPGARELSLESRGTDFTRVEWQYLETYYYYMEQLSMHTYYYD